MPCARRLLTEAEAEAARTRKGAAREVEAARKEVGWPLSWHKDYELRSQVCAF